jgi:hypothetical protein
MCDSWAYIDRLPHAGCTSDNFISFDSCEIRQDEILTPLCCCTCGSSCFRPCHISRPVGQRRRSNKLPSPIPSIHELTSSYQGSCARVPTSNSPVTSVSSTAFRCNGRSGVPGKCTVAAGQTVTVEMHQQPGDRSCTNEAIGGAHYGPVIVYMSKVPDATTADGSTGWFKIFQDTWAPV